MLNKVLNNNGLTDPVSHSISGKLKSPTINTGHFLFSLISPVIPSNKVLLCSLENFGE